ncbi:MAG: GNAT family N-acetyltransferase [Pyrinomonadaceae bacterium]
MAVLDKLRDFWDFFPFVRATKQHEPLMVPYVPPAPPAALLLESAELYELHPLTLSHLDELWQLDKRCFVNGEAYSRATLQYLLGEPNGLSYRIVLSSGAMVGFIITMLETDGTGHITTIGVAPEHRRQGLAYRLLQKAENAYLQRNVRLMRLEVRTANTGAQQLYACAGYAVMQRLARYYANGGDGLLMIKSLI